MMHLFNVLLIIAILFISSCSNPKTEYSEQNPPIVSQPCFVSVPITKLNVIECPCVNVEIESQVFSMELDLGFRGHLSIQDIHRDLISEKTFLFEKTMWGARGKYVTPVYQIAKVKIGNMTFYEPRLKTDSQEFLKDSTFVAEGRERSPRESGRIGWELFQTTNLFIDITKGQIGFCNSLDTLAKKGYLIDQFIKTPLFLDNGLVQIYLETPEGALLTMLDTGCTLNLLNRDIQTDQSIDELMLDLTNTIEFASCKINDVDFGPVEFSGFPIKLPVQVDAILGMDFIKNHVIFLDFVHGFAYIEKTDL